MGVRASQRSVALRAKGIQAHGNTLETGLAQGAGMPGQQHPVGRQRQVSNPAVLRQQPHQPVQVAAQQRLASGQPHLLYSQAGEDLDELPNLLKAEDLLALEPDVLFLRHAILAAQVAPVRDRDAQGAHRPAEGVEDRD